MSSLSRFINPGCISGFTAMRESQQGGSKSAAVKKSKTPEEQGRNGGRISVDKFEDPFTKRLGTPNGDRHRVPPTGRSKSTNRARRNTLDPSILAGKFIFREHIILDEFQSRCQYYLFGQCPPRAFQQKCLMRSSTLSHLIILPILLQVEANMCPKYLRLAADVNRGMGLGWELICPHPPLQTLANRLAARRPPQLPEPSIASCRNL